MTRRYIEIGNRRLRANRSWATCQECADPIGPGQGIQSFDMRARPAGVTCSACRLTGIDADRRR